MRTSRRFGRCVVLFLLTISALNVASLRAWSQITQITLASSSTPLVGQAGVTVNSVTGGPFPSGTLPPANVKVTLTPSGGGTTVSTTASAVTTVVGSTYRISFLVPPSITVSTPTKYLVSISGTTSGGSSFASANSSAITINPPATITLTPNSGATGNTATLTIAGTYSTFIQGMTTANFGPNTAVNGGSSGGFGVLTVTSPTSATAQVQIDAAASLGPRTITVQTSRQVETALFTITSGAPPIADAGPGQTVPVGTTVTLDGSKSSDPGGHALTYQWSVVQIPTGSTAALSDPTAVMPTFTVDKFGGYKFQLVVNNGTQNSAPSFVTISTSSTPPTAKIAALTTTPHVGDTLTFDGSGSFDTDGFAITTYAWTISGPAGSAVALNNPAAVMPTATLDKFGSYTVQLTVTDSRNLVSQPAVLTFNTQSLTPIANCGSDQSVDVNQNVFLDGSTSISRNDLPLFYKWSFNSKPASSTAAFSDPASSKPSFLADKPGLYVVQLVVNDVVNGVPNPSTPCTLNVSTQVLKPVANAGTPQTVTLGTTVDLDGTASTDPQNLPLTYKWTIASVPTGSGITTASITNSNQALASFKPDVITGAQLYVLTLVVNNGFLDSDPSNVTITVTPAAASKLSLSGFPNPATAGTPGSFTVTLRDAFNNVATGYRGTVHFTSSDGQAVLPADYTFTAADAGVHTFAATLKTTGAQSLTATDAANPALTGSQTGIVVNASTTGSLSLSGFTNPATAGTAGSFTVTLRDALNNVATGYRGTVHFTSSDGQAVLPADYTFTAADAGVHTFNATLKTAGTQSITGTDTVTSVLTGSQTGIVVNPAVASKFALSGFPNPATAGVAGGFTVTVRDAFNNVATGYRGTVHFTTSDAQAVLPADYTFVAADAGAHTFSATLKTAGTQALTGTDTVTVSLSGSQTGIVVNPAAASKLSLAGFPNPATAGVSGGFTVTLRDAFNNIAASYRGTVHFTTSDAQAILPADYTFAAADAGVHAFAATLKTTGTQSLTATDSVTLALTGSQTGIVVNPATTGSLTLTGFPNPATSGTAASFTVTLRDALNNVATGYRGTVHFTSSDAQAILPADYTFTTTDAGVHTFSATLKTAGTQSLTGTDTVTAGLSGSQAGIVVNPGPPTKLAFTVQPTNAAAGGPIAPAVQVTLQDAAGNTTTATSQVTIALGSNPGSATLSGTTTVNAVAGIATFTNLSLNKVATGYTLIASSTGVTSATSNPFNITAGAPAKLAFTVQPSNTVSGAAISPAVQVTIQDAAGNTALVTNPVTIAIGTNPSFGTLSGTATVAAVNGVATFANLTLDKAGTGYTLSASSTGLTSTTSNPFNIAAGAPTKVVYTVQPTNTASGAPIAPAVQVVLQDAAGNISPVTNTVAIAIATNPSSGTLAGTTSLAAVNGTVTFSNLSINKAGNGYTLTASSAGLTSATSNAFNITPGAAAKLAFSVQPSNTQAGSTITPSPKVTIQDAAGNTVTSASNSVTLAIGTNPSAGTLSGTLTVAAANGVATFNGLSINNVGTGYTLSATSTGLTSATSNTFNITGGALSISTTDSLIGIGRSIGGTVTLPSPAGPGGVTITLGSSNTALATISPASVTILQGSSSAPFTVTGVAAGGPVTLTASATGFTSGATQVSVTATVISFGTIPPVAPGQSVSLPVSLSSPAGAGGVTINLVSVNPSIATITPSVFVPAGLQTPTSNPQVTGVTIGSTTVNASASGFAPDSRSLTVTVVASFNPNPVSVAATRTQTVALNISAPAPQPSGITFTLSTDNTSTATVPASVTIAAGSLSANVQVTGVAPGSTTLRADSPGVTEATATVNVSPAPAMNVSSTVTVGNNLQTALSGSLSTPAPPITGTTIHIVSTDPTKVLLSTSPTVAGSSSIDVAISPGSSFITTFQVQALDKTGSVAINYTAPGYANATTTVNLSPSGFAFLTGSFTTTSFSPNSNLDIRPWLLTAGTLTITSNQSLRAGIAPVQVAISSDNTAIGTVVNSGGTAISSITFNGNDIFNTAAFFHPVGGSANPVHLTLTQPAGFDTPSSGTSIAVTVSAPNISGLPPTLAVGHFLQTSFFVSLQSTPPSPVSVTVSSNSPNVLLSTSATVAGTQSVTFNNVSSTSVGSVFVQGAGAAGTTAQLTASATGFTGATSTVTVNPSGLAFATGNFTTTTFSANTALDLRPWMLTQGTLAIQANQALMAGVTPVQVGVSSDNTSIGTIVNSVGNPISSVTLNGNDVFNTSAFFHPVGGSANPAHLSVTQPTGMGFSVPSSNTSIAVTVTAPNINGVPASISVGHSLQTSFFLSLQNAPPSPVTVTVTSNSPNVLLSSSATAAGSQTLTFNNVSSTTVGSIFVQGAGAVGSTAQITASATGFNPASGTVTVNPSGFAFLTGDFATTTFAANSSLDVRPWMLAPGTLVILGNQNLMGGISPIQVNLSDDNTAVGTLVNNLGTAISSVTFNANDVVNTSAFFHPIAASVTPAHLSVAQPAGFSTPASNVTISVTVSAPNINGMPATMNVGHLLETQFFLSLQNTPPNPVSVTITSSSPAVLLSTSQTGAGSQSITFNNVTTTSVGTIWVQGAGNEGLTAQLKAQASGFNDATSTVTVNPSGISFNTGNFTIGHTSSNTALDIRTWMLSPGTLAIASNQNLMGGTSIQVNLASDNTAAGTIVNSGGTAISSVTFNGGDVVNTSAFFHPVAAGTAHVIITEPVNLDTPSTGLIITVTVN